MLVSFIIPAYNATDTIIRCLDSIYGLSLKRDEFEVVVVDDASSDNTVAVIDQFVESLHSLTPSFINSLRILRQPQNHRQGAARNRGVKVANGEYVCFVDADDVVTEGMVSAIRLAKAQQTDMTALHFAFANEQGTITFEAQKLSFADERVFSGVEMLNTHPYWCSAPWGFIYRRVFMEQVNYPFAEDVLYEDSDFVVAHLFYAKRITYMSGLGYVAYYREGSTTRSVSYMNVADYLLLGTRMLKLYDALEDKSTKYAESILEGGSYNIWKAFRKLVRLQSVSEVRDFYDRVDARFDRKLLLGYRKPAYCWTSWTRFGLKHKRLFICLLGFAFPIVKLIQK